MPVTPTDLNRNALSLADLLKLIDKELIQANKRTLKGAPYLSLNAPAGTLDYKQEIIDAYVGAGWFKVDYVEGYNALEQDVLHFFPVEPANPY